NSRGEATTKFSLLRGSIDRIQERFQAGNALQPVPAFARHFLVRYLLVVPRQRVWDVDAAGAGGDDRDDVRAERVADHHELFEVGGGDSAARDLDRRLEHRERERLHAVAVEVEVAHLDVGEVPVDVGIGDVAAHEIAKGGLGQVEARLVVPERVVAVEC